MGKEKYYKEMYRKLPSSGRRC